MSIFNCLEDAVNEGRLSRDKADETMALYDELAADLANTMHGDAAQVEAGRRAYEAMAFELAQKKRRELLRIKTWQRINMQMHTFRNAKGEADFGAAMMAHLDRNEFATFSNVDGRRKAILGRFHQDMDNFLATFRRDLSGAVREKATLNNVVREIFGTDTKNQAAKELAEAWSSTAEKARKRFNAAGGRIPKRKDWGMPQTHDSVVVNKAGFKDWRDFTIDKLDPAKMINESTGLPFTRGQLELALKDVYETIRTDGLNKVKAMSTGSGQGKSLANRRLDHRFLVFKDADNWLAYNDRFGGNDPFSVMMSHLDGMARDIASMEILGPSPTGTLRFMETTAKKWAIDNGSQDKVASNIKSSWDMYSIYTGSSNAPIHGKAARTMAGVRSYLQSAQLGAAAVSSITDLNTGRMARKMVGLPQKKMIKQITKLLKPTDLSDQKLAVRLGLIAENWATVASAQQRYVGEVSGTEISRRVADVVMRVSGLSAWTQAGRWSFGMEFMGALADHAGKTFDLLPAEMQKTMRKYGIDTTRWETMRTSPLYQHEGAAFLRPEDIAGRNDVNAEYADDTAMRLLEMIQAETEFAVPSTSLRGRAALVGNLQPGTIQGELIRSVGMYKNFSVTLMYTHIARMIAEKSALGKMGYAANMVISTTLMGALAIQLKEISKGRDPRPMNIASFWGAALMQGGGLGIFGDFLSSSTSRFGSGLGETVAGPVVGFADDVLRLTVGNAVELGAGQKTNAGAEVSNFLRRYIPGGSLWYGRAAFERTIFDEIQKAIDPDAQDRMRRMETRYKNETGQRFWWRPGQMLPDRAPDLNNAMEAQ